MPEVQVKTFYEPAPKKPVLICGLPGSGYVGKLAADYLVSSFKAKKFVELYSLSFPPHVNVNEDGNAQMLKGELYHCEMAEGSDLLIFTADAQPTTSAGEYELADVVLSTARKMQAELVFSLAAYITGAFVKDRRVFGASTSASLLPKLVENGVHVMHEGGISGVNGVIVGMAKLHGMEGISLLGETSGYLLDPSASHAVLESLARILGIKIDLASMEERAKEAQQVISQIQRMSGQEPEEGEGKGRPEYIG